MENTNPSDILYSVENGMLKIVLNRPKRKNAITIPMYKKIFQILRESIQDDNIYVTVLTGTGEFFSSGNDFSSVFTMQDTENFDFTVVVNVFKEFVDMLITYPKLLIAVVNGPAIGIAVTMLPLFDMVYASKTAYFYTPFTKLGLVAEGCSTYTFPKILGQSKAGDMLYLGYRMSAPEAKQYGLVSELYKYECLDEVWTYLKKLTDVSSKSILASKCLVKKWDQKILLKVNSEEATEIKKCIQSPDFLENIMNFASRKSKL
ncbi:Enoyl-CoA delta isomerase 2 [Anthophora retusa]